MKKKALSIITAFLLLMGMLTLTFDIQSVLAQGTIIVPDDYPTIQAAIDAANSGDTVFVKAGTYFENVVISKTLALVGENAQTTILDASGTGTVINVMANQVIIEGFTIRNSGYGTDGVHINGYNQTIIRNNNIKNNGQYGIGLYYSFFNTVSGINVTNNWSGINLSYSSNNTISANNMTDNGYGIVLAYSSSNNSASRNRIKAQTGTGIVLSGWSSNNTVSGNVIANTENGIGIYLSSSNVIFENNVTNTGSGIYVSDFSNNNTIYHNNLINNTNQVYSSESANVWDDGYPSGGNYWSDYTGDDSYSGPYQNETASDGIGDTQYAIDTDNTDRYPLMNPFIVTIPGDVNGDKRVDILDLEALGKAYGSIPTSPNWNARADINNDLIVNMVDLFILSKNYGKIV